MEKEIKNLEVNIQDNDYAKALREEFKKNHKELEEKNLIKGVSPAQGKHFKAPTFVKFLSLLATIYMVITAIMYILTYLGIPIMAI